MNRLGEMVELKKSDEDVDVERLIFLVSQYPAIWDKTCQEYHIRANGTSAWRNICRELCPRFAEMTQTEKELYGKFVMKKWRNIRDQWAKAYKKVIQLKKTGTPKGLIRYYVYHKQLRFLQKTLNTSESSCEDKSSNNELSNDASENLDGESQWNSNEPENLEYQETESPRLSSVLNRQRPNKPDLDWSTYFYHNQFRLLKETSDIKPDAGLIQHPIKHFDDRDVKLDGSRVSGLQKQASPAENCPADYDGPANDTLGSSHVMQITECPKGVKPENGELSENVELSHHKQSNSSSHKEPKRKKPKVSSDGRNPKTSQDDDPKLLFFKSIIPHIKDFTDDEMLQLQSGVIHLVQTVKRFRLFQSLRPEYAALLPSFPNQPYMVPSQASTSGFHTPVPQRLQSEAVKKAPIYTPSDTSMSPIVSDTSTEDFDFGTKH